MWSYVIVLLAAIVVMKLLEKNTSKKSSTKELKEKSIKEYRGHYQAKNLLTKNEWHEYKKLKQYAKAYGLQVCPKVRLLDIVEPKNGDPNYMAYMGKVKSKHVDFAICDADLHIMGILELDDSSHDRPDRQERDQFVDEILRDVGYTVIHTRYITESTLDQSLKQLSINIARAQELEW